MMNRSDSSNPAINESDLLALVEGVALPPERAAAVREALGRDPRLAELAAMMRSDREMLASMPEATAPADLLDRVEMQLEREALVGLARSEAQSANDALPVSIVIPQRQNLLSAPWFKPLAAAAALALMAGGTMLLYSTNKPKPVTPITPDIAENPNHNERVDKPAPVEIAKKDPEVNTAPVIAVKVQEPVTVEPRPVVPEPTVASITPAQALEAAMNDRLVLRIRARDASAVEARVKSIAAASTRGLGIEDLAGASYDRVVAAYISTREEAIAASTPKPAPVQPAKPIEPAPIAGNVPTAEKPVARPIGSAPESKPMPTQPEPISLMGKAFVLTLPPLAGQDATALEALRKSLTNEQMIVEFEIIKKPITLEVPTDAGSILWWSTPPATWGRKVRLPVVIEAN